MEYTLNISKRVKRASIKVIESQVVVTAPPIHCKQELHLFVLNHKNWIEKQLKHQDKLSAIKNQQRFEDGGQFRYLGELLTIRSADIKNTTLIEKSLNIPRGADIKLEVYEWLQTQALSILENKTIKYAKILNVKVKQIQLGKFKSKWGSAHPDGTIKYSWLIIQAPEKIIEYLVIHEVAHLIEMNHSKKFWAIVAKLCPTYKERKTWLRQQSQKLSLL